MKQKIKSGLITKFGLRYYLSILLLILVKSMSAQEWNFVKERDGIQIFTRNEKNNCLKSFRGEADVKTCLEKIYEMIGNVQNVDWWDEDISELRILSQQKDQFVNYYLIYDVPWPLTDRDLCVQAHIRTDAEKGCRTVYAEPLPDKVAEKPGLVRIKNYWQKWTIQDKGNGVIHLTLEGFVDPAGKVPAWLYNLVITDTPLKIIRGIKDCIESN